MEELAIPSVRDVIRVICEEIRTPRHAYYRGESPEKTMENAIAKQFEEKYGKHNVSQQYSVGGFLSLKCDIDLFDTKCCGIELKLEKQLHNATAMQRVIGQVAYYSKRCYQDSGLILLVIGTEKNIDSKLDELRKFIEEFPNTYFVYKQAN